MTDVDTLIRDLEAAPEVSRKLDAEVWASIATNADFGCPTFSVGWEPRFEASEDGKVTLYAKNMKTEEWLERSRRPAPFYTTSLDAALTLVPEGWGWMIDWTEPTERPRAVLCHEPTVTVECREASTPALALCIAALKARNAS